MTCLAAAEKLGEHIEAVAMRKIYKKIRIALKEDRRLEAMF
jgi:hypothetical protein